MKRIISFLLVLILMFSVPFTAGADSVTTVIACSDFQHPDGNDSGKSTVMGLVSTLKSYGITSADGFLCCGDYNYNNGNTKAGIDALTGAVSGIVNENLVFVRGNHDEQVSANVGLSKSGKNDTDAYGVYVIHESDYMRTNSDEATIKKTAQYLINYLNEKLEIGYNKPIFVLSHLPLHYSMRTRLDGDAKYANYIFDALNAAGKKGLNIIFMYGHDHSNGWDDYLGGAAVYLKKGDNILIAQNSKTSFLTKTLNFTYMNAGFVGYYQNRNGADDTLTMTSFKISLAQVEIARFDSSSYHNLKSAGVTNAYKNESGYSPDTTVYTSPATVTLTAVSDRTPIADLEEKYNPNKAEGERFEKVTAVSELENGKYLLIYNSSSDYIMMPTAVIKSNNSGSRQGYDLKQYTSTGEDIFVESDIAKYAWSFEKTAGGWYIGDGTKKAKFTSTADMSVTATLEDIGDVFTISGSDGAFEFAGGGYVFNYNSRVLINGFATNPAPFYIYRYAGHSVIVEGGSSNVKSAKAGDSVIISANPAPDGKLFDRWEYVTGSGYITDLTQNTVTFIMPDSPVKIKAVYKDKPHSHNYRPLFDNDGHFEMCSGCGDVINKVAHVFDNGCDNNCACGYTRITAHDFGAYIYNNDANEIKDGTKTSTCSICRHKETITATGTKWTSDFTDVKKTGFYYVPMLWAVASDITKGTSDYEFSPYKDCTRGQIVTFLWRAAGCPEPKNDKMPFADVGNKAFYRKAVLWAVENGITTGTSDTTFSPEKTCTRGEAVTFLWRAKGKPQSKNSTMKFTDVKNGYCYKAVLWAVENKITAGKGNNKFEPDTVCNRGEIVTFLYRTYN